MVSSPNLSMARLQLHQGFTSFSTTSLRGVPQSNWPNPLGSSALAADTMPRPSARTRASDERRAQTAMSDLPRGQFVAAHYIDARLPSSPSAPRPRPLALEAGQP